MHNKIASQEESPESYLNAYEDPLFEMPEGEKPEEVMNITHSLKLSWASGLNISGYRIGIIYGCITNMIGDL